MVDLLPPNMMFPPQWLHRAFVRCNRNLRRTWRLHDYGAIHGTHPSTTMVTCRGLLSTQLRGGR